MRSYHKILKVFLYIFAILIIIGLIYNGQIKDYCIKYQSSKYSMNSINKKVLKMNQDEQKKLGSKDTNVSNDNNKDVNHNNNLITFDFDDVKPISLKKVLVNQIDQSKKDNLPVVASIAVPSVKLNLPIFLGVSDENLNAGAGTMRADQVLGVGNYPLAGHYSYDADILFAPIKKISLGDDIYVTDMKDVYTYKAYEHGVISPKDSDIINDDQGNKIITLITCNDFQAKNRFYVQGMLVNVNKIEDSNKKVLLAFNLKFNDLYKYVN